MPYIAYETELYLKQWKALCKKDKPLETRLREVVEGIIRNPENYDSTLQGDRCRSVKKKAVGNHYRVIYRYCQLCMQIQKIACDDCQAAGYALESIIFLEVFHRDDDY